MDGSCATIAWAITTERRIAIRNSPVNIAKRDIILSSIKTLVLRQMLIQPPLPPNPSCRTPKVSPQERVNHEGPPVLLKGLDRPVGRIRAPEGVKTRRTSTPTFSLTLRRLILLTDPSLAPGMTRSVPLPLKYFL